MDETINFGRIAVTQKKIEKKIERADQVLEWVDDARVAMIEMLAVLELDLQHRPNFIQQFKIKKLKRSIEELLERTGQ